MAKPFDATTKQLIESHPAELPDLYRQIGVRLAREAAPAKADVLWTATYILSGLRHGPDLVWPILQGVRQMKESATYQAILAEGEAMGVAKGVAKARRDDLLQLGTRRFGPPDSDTRAALEAIADPDRLTALVDRLLDVDSWKELFRPDE